MGQNLEKGTGTGLEKPQMKPTLGPVGDTCHIPVGGHGSGFLNGKLVLFLHSAPPRRRLLAIVKVHCIRQRQNDQCEWKPTNDARELSCSGINNFNPQPLKGSPATCSTAAASAESPSRELIDRWVSVNLLEQSRRVKPLLLYRRNLDIFALTLYHSRREIQVE